MWGMFIKRSVFIGVPLILALAGSALGAEIKVAYVDIQRALNECDAGKRARDEFRAKVQKLERKLQKQQEEVKALKDELETKGLLMKPEERRSLEEDYNRKLRDFERAYNDSKQDLQHEDSIITSKIVRDLTNVVGDIGRREGYTLVMEKSTILFGAPGIDITDQVIREYNERTDGTAKKTGQNYGSTTRSSTSRSSQPRSTISK